MNSGIPARRKALLIDDHILVRRGVRLLMQLSSPQLDIEEAGSIPEALALLETTEVDLSFLDLDLGSQQSGLDLLAEMHRRGRGLPAIVLSAFDDRDTIMRCLDAGASGFITKASGDEEVFRAAIDAVIGGRVYLPSSALGKGGREVKTALFKRGTPLDDFGLKPSLQRTLMYVYQGMGNKAIAREMNISEYTARDYCSELYRFFGVARRSQLIVELARRGMALPEKVPH